VIVIVVVIVVFLAYELIIIIRDAIIHTTPYTCKYKYHITP